MTAALLTLAEPVRAEWYGEAIDLMGTRVSVELWHDDPDAGEALVADVLNEYRRIDRLMSTYKADSEISRLNNSAVAGPVEIDRELFDLIGRALALSQASSGAFDISYESIGYLYDFRRRIRPDTEQLRRGLEAVDFSRIQLDEQTATVFFEVEGMRINLGGIAKGYAVERGAAMLAEQGVRHALLNAGGDSRVLGDRRGEPWVIGIRHPRADGEVFTRLPIVDEAISTSGDYERFFDEDGRRYHHIIDPTTGEPTNGMLSVTVMGPDATITDGLSTTVFVLGVEAGIDLIESFEGYESVVVDSGGGLHYSQGLVAPGDN